MDDPARPALAARGQADVRHAPRGAVATRAPAVRRALVVTRVLVVALTLGAAVVVALWAAGAARPPLVADPGPTVRWGLPVVTGLGRGAAALTVGALVLCICVLSPTDAEGRTWARARRWATTAAAAWVLLQVLQLVLTFRDVVGGGPLVPPPAQLGAFLELGVGRTLGATAVLVALVAVGALVTRTPGEALAVLVLAAAALLQQAGTGHAASTVGHGVAVLGLWLHVLAACVWVGGLAVLSLPAPRLAAPTSPGDPPSGHPPSGRPSSGHPQPGHPTSVLSVVAGRYSTIAGWAYFVLALSGLFSLVVRVTSPGDVLTSPWGRLLLVKVLALGLLGLAGAAHRGRTLPLLAQGRPRAFIRLAAGEVLVMAAVLGLSSALARTDPPDPQVPASTDVVALTGYAAPPPPSVLTLLTEVRVEPVTLLMTGGALLVYALGVLRLRAAGATWPWSRTISAVVGLLGLAWVTSGGLAVYGSVLLSARVAQQLVLVGVIPVALVLAAPGALARDVLSAREDGALGPLEWLDAAAGTRLLAWLRRPSVAGAHAAAALAVLHLTPLRWLDLTSQVVHLLVVLYLSSVGVLLATALQPILPAPRARYVAPYLALTALLGLHLWTSTVLVEPGFYERLSLPWLTDPLLDQRRAAVVAWALGGLSALALVLARKDPSRPALYHGGRARAPGSV